MVDSGIKVCHSCDAVIGDLEADNLEYIILVIEGIEKGSKGKGKVVIKEKSLKGESEKELEGVDLKGVPPAWYRFTQKIKSYHCAFGSCHVSYKTNDGRNPRKLPFIFWSVDEKASVIEKMTYSATKLTCSKKIKSIDTTIQCQEEDDLDYKKVVAKLQQFN